jgi:hypothetical protein
MMRNQNTFQALSGTNIFVLGTDGNLWLEQGPFGVVPPPRKQVDTKVKAFEALSDNELLILDNDGALWLASGPFDTVPPQRQQVEERVTAFQAISDTKVAVLTIDSNLWLEHTLTSLGHYLPSLYFAYNTAATTGAAPTPGEAVSTDFNVVLKTSSAGGA